MAAVVAVADGDAAGVEVNEEGVEGRETGGVGQAVRVHQGGEGCFEAGGCWSGEAGVDVGIVGWVGVGL